MGNQPKTIRLELTIEEANIILEALGNLPFREVFHLVGIIQGQAEEQLNGQMKTAGTKKERS